MSSQETVILKKRGPKPTGKGQQVQIRMHADMLEAIDRFIELQPDPKPTRPETVRQIVKVDLQKRGLLDAKNRD